MIPVDDDVKRICSEEGRIFRREGGKYTLYELLCWGLWAEHNRWHEVSVENAILWVERNPEYMEGEV